MYQHDIKEARLAKTLNDIVTECVSFVGKKPFFKDLTSVKHILTVTTIKPKEANSFDSLDLSNFTA